MAYFWIPSLNLKNKEIQDFFSFVMADRHIFLVIIGEEKKNLYASLRVASIDTFNYAIIQNRL